MALLFNSTTDYVRVAGDSSFDSPTEFTMYLWVNPTTLSGEMALVKPGVSTGPVFNISWRSPYDEIECWIGRATVDAHILTTGLDLTTSKWWFLALTFSSANDCRIWAGDLTTLVSECSYDGGVTDQGSGALDNQPYCSGDYMYVCTYDDNDARNFVGDAANFQFIHKDIGLAGLLKHQFEYVREPETKIWHPRYGLGSQGTGTQTDWSGYGNDGTTNGVSVSDHPPLIIAPLVRHSVSPAPHALPARVNVRSNVSLIPARDHWGPFNIGTKLYTLAYQAVNTPGMYATATLDPSLGFLEKDGSSRPGANAGGAMVACIGGASTNQIGMVYVGSSSGDDPYFAEFNTVAQTWSETDDQIVAVAQSNENVGIVWRPQAAEYVVAFNGDQVSTYHMAYYSRRTGASTWSTPVALYTGTPVGDCFIQTTILGANDQVHFVLNYNGDLFVRTLSKDNTLSDWPTSSFASADTYEAVAAPVRYEE